MDGDPFDEILRTYDEALLALADKRYNDLFLVMQKRTLFLLNKKDQFYDWPTNQINTILEQTQNLQSMIEMKINEIEQQLYTITSTAHVHRAYAQFSRGV